MTGRGRLAKGAAPPSILWFRQDLRLADQPALRAAAATGGPVIPVYIWSPQEEGEWPPGAAARWWIARSLRSLETELQARGSFLVIRRGPAAAALRALARETGAERIVYTRRIEPAAREQEEAVRQAFPADGRPEAVGCPGSLLFEPEEVRTRAGGPFQVFTPFYRACLALTDRPEPFSAPRRILSPARRPRSQACSELALDATSDPSGDLAGAWSPGEAGARRRLARFLRSGLSGYAADRDRPDRERTSALSPYLHHGELSPRRVWSALRGGGAAADPFRRQLLWREFAAHLLWHFPHTPLAPLRPEYAAFRWRRDADGLAAWQGGRTGVPLVDAGMRQLRSIGWMHNRVRMVAGSFLVKDLLLSWQDGARWFWERLVDADLANNTLGWQWVAGCGADAAPYFRVFNPYTQGERYDPAGAYVRRWVPELAPLPDRWVHRPHGAPPPVREAAGLVAGSLPYPQPLIAHDVARARALAAYDRLRRRQGGSACAS